MSAKSEQFQAYVAAFDERYVAAEDPTEKEIQRRNRIVGEALLREAEAETASVLPEASIVSSGLWLMRGHAMTRQERRERLVFASIYSGPRAQMPTEPVELLESLYNSDGVFTHDLTRPIF